MPARVLLIDNYDSFVFNLARYLAELGVETTVRRNDELTVAEVRELRPDAIVLSPGPCTPNEAGICVELIQSLEGETPLLGVCLGHQAIGAALGATVARAPNPVHGQASLIHHHSTGLFANCPNPLRVGRYHSLIVEEATLPPNLVVTARTDDGLVMAFTQRDKPVFGVQFHPESILTDCGHRLLANFLTLSGITCKENFLSQELPAETLPDDDFYRREIDAEVFRPW
ncbi:anthranilate synthase component II [Planctomicrobium piriforme]|uniref:Anthranilate synthase component 2 n=1 Tax=Planctomicrobium piriforme TaxID=1576369 RepID=A0A1I3FCX7_9PLAN|nr:aminodeoxychorismate/anthranilate synthase component II [Planctomicrobium piriforme]SFI09073.1 anthranilate synthase component 2 [Planctomicrobium piriforme]